MFQSLDAEQASIMAGYLAGIPEVTLAFVFGSVARGQGRPDSDLDCAVLLSVEAAQTQFFDLRLRLLDGLARLLQRDDIDLVILNEASLALAYRVLRDGTLLFERGHEAYVEYRVLILGLYFDFAPFLEGFERAFLRRVSEDGLLYGYDPYHGTAQAHKKVLATAERASGHAA